MRKKWQSKRYTEKQLMQLIDKAEAEYKMVMWKMGYNRIVNMQALQKKANNLLLKKESLGKRLATLKTMVLPGIEIDNPDLG